MRRSVGSRAGPVVLAALLGLSGCTSDAEVDPGPGPGPTAAPAEPFALTARVARVAGRLPAGTRGPLAEEIGEVVEAYLRAAFVEAGPRDVEAALASFTPRGRVAARAQAAVLLAEAWPEDTVVDTRRARARIWVLAPRRQPAGATARVAVTVSLAAAADAAPRRLRVRGRLLLTPTAQGWRIFGFHLTRSGAAS